MKKVVLKLELHDDKSKQKAMKTVSGLSGVESVAMDMKDKKLTITGDIDPVKVVGKLRKLCRTEIVTVGPAKEPEKKKEEPKKEEPKKADEKKNDKNTNKDANNPLPPHMQQPYYHHQAYYPPPPMQSFYNNHHQRSAEDDPNSCVIC